MAGDERIRPRDRFSLFELALIIGTGFGGAIYYSVLDVVQGTTLGMRPNDDTFGVDDTYEVIIDELIAAPFMALILYVGGWRLKDFRLGISVRTTVLGIVVCAAFWPLNWLMVLGMQAMFPYLHTAIEAWASFRPQNPPGLGAVLLLALVNPVFEEVFACAYVIKVLHRRIGLTAAVWISAVIRTSYHLYQGVTTVPFHLSVGLIHGFIYARYGRLWPIILSHALANFIAGAWYLF